VGRPNVYRKTLECEDWEGENVVDVSFVTIILLHRFNQSSFADYRERVNDFEYFRPVKNGRRKGWSGRLISGSE
jgi:hypothetical protein